MSDEQLVITRFRSSILLHIIDDPPLSMTLPLMSHYRPPKRNKSCFSGCQPEAFVGKPSGRLRTGQRTLVNSDLEPNLLRGSSRVDKAQLPVLLCCSTMSIENKEGATILFSSGPHSILQNVTNGPVLQRSCARCELTTSLPLHVHSR